MKKLTTKEINELLVEAERAADEQRSLTAVFSDFATRTGRARGGIRNLYYGLLKDGQSDEGLRKIYPSLNRLKAERNKAFTKSEEDELFSRVSAGVKSGKSVRRTIGEMANGDERTALRFQNKYRNLLKKRGLATRFSAYKNEADYKALKKAVDDLFERIVKQKSEKESQLKRENQALKAQIRSLKAEVEESRAKKFFLTRAKSNAAAKSEEVPE